MTTPEEREELWRQMAALTMRKCLQSCKCLGACCDRMYCKFAAESARFEGVRLKRTGNRVPFLDNEGKCIVPPHLRQMCALHQCYIGNIGICPDDPEWTKEYFDLRARLEEIEGDLYE